MVITITYLKKEDRSKIMPYTSGSRTLYNLLYIVMTTVEIP